MADGMVRSKPEAMVDFMKLIPEGRGPKRADRSAAGHLPGRAMRYCDAITSATGFGYWAFPPIDMQLVWDGEQIMWCYGDAEEWLPLSNTPSSAVQFPGFADVFDESAPEEMKGFSPPFMTALAEPGLVQIWTGLLARTRPGWSLLVRSAVNLGTSPGLAGWEGLIETDQWFGPIFCVFRITRTDFPVHFRSDVPFLQIQPVPQAAYRDDALNEFTTRSMDDMQPSDWNDLGDAILPTTERLERAGTYAVKVRKRRTCPLHAGVVQAAVDGD